VIGNWGLTKVDTWQHAQRFDSSWWSIHRTRHGAVEPNCHGTFSPSRTGAEASRSGEWLLELLPSVEARFEDRLGEFNDAIGVHLSSAGIQRE